MTLRDDPPIALIDNGYAQNISFCELDKRKCPDKQRNISNTLKKQLLYWGYTRTRKAPNQHHFWTWLNAIVHGGLVRKGDKTLIETYIKQFKSVFHNNLNQIFYSIPKSVCVCVGGGGNSEIVSIFPRIIKQTIGRKP